MILRNVVHRPVRTVITVLAVAVEVTLVVLVVGLTSGLLHETAKRIEGVGADLMLQPPSASVFMAFSGAPMPIRVREKLEELRYVQAVAPVLLQFNASGGLDIVYGIEPESFRAVSGGFVILQGRDLESPNDILVDDWYAKAKNIKLGQSLRLFENDFQVSGIVEHGKGARLFVNIRTLQELSGAREKASLFFLKCTRPEHAQEVSDEMRALFPKHEIRPLKDFLSLMTSSNLPGLNTFVNAMIALAVAIGFLVIFLSLYTTIIERTREIGVLKSLGASKMFIVKALISETLLLVGLGIVCGVGMGLGAQRLVQGFFPTLTVLISWEWMIRAALIAVFGGLLGAAYPAWLASRRDPVEALSYD
jgi:putative ABC transport system permease protein